MNDNDKAFIIILIVVLASLDKTKRKGGITVIYGLVIQLMPTISEVELDLVVQEILTLIATNNGDATNLLNKSNLVLPDLQKQCYCYAVEIALSAGTISTASQTILDALKTDWSITDAYENAVKDTLTERIKAH